MSGSRPFQTLHALSGLLRRLAGRADGERGTAAVEMALVLPMFLLLATGLGTLGHAYVIKYQLHTAAYNAARTCSLTNNTTTACAQQEVTQTLGSFRSNCGGNPITNLTDLQAVPGVTGLPFDTARVIRVDVQCNFKGGVGLGFLRGLGILTGPIRVSAALPF